MNALELVSYVKANVKDDSFDDAHILALLNEALLKVSYELCLPDLQAREDMTFDFGDDPFTALPDDFYHDLWHAENISSPWRDVRVHTSVHSLQRMYPRDDEFGDIRDAAIDGMVLHVRPAPDPGQTLRVWYYRRPELLTLDESSEPEAILPHMHAPVIAYYAIAKIYDEIEDGVDGNKTNANNWDAKWQRDGFLALSAMQGVKRSARATPYVRRHPRWF